VIKNFNMGKDNAKPRAGLTADEKNEINSLVSGLLSNLTPCSVIKRGVEYTSALKGGVMVCFRAESVELMKSIKRKTKKQKP